MNVADLLQRLIRCPSVTPHEGGALQLMRDELQALGFKVELLTFSAPNTPDVTNLYARLGTQAPFFLFAGHTDVVPTGDESTWRFPPFSAELSEGRIFGRGACDMKGGVAAFTAAVASYLKDKGAPNGSIGFLITGDEEGPAINGTVKVLEWMKQQGEVFDLCVLGEPAGRLQAGDRIKVGARGSYSARLTVTGTQGHSAYPERSNNPIPHLMRMLAAINGKLDEGNAHFPASELVITDLHVGNEASNVIPRDALAAINVRFNNDWTSQTLEQELRKRLKESAETVTWELVPRIGNTEAFLSDAGQMRTRIARIVEKIIGHAPEFHTSGGTSDARFIVHDGPVIEMGMAGTSLHQTDENITLKDLDQTVEIYRAVLDDYFA